MANMATHVGKTWQDFEIYSAFQSHQDASCLAAVTCTFCKVVESEFTPDKNREICTSPLGTKKLPMDL